MLRFVSPYQGTVGLMGWCSFYIRRGQYLPPLLEVITLIATAELIQVSECSNYAKLTANMYILAQGLNYTYFFYLSNIGC